MSETFVNLGRTRGEFERAAKKLVQAHHGVKHPRELGFIAQADCADRMAAAMVLCNGLVKEGRLQKGVPDERWTRSTLANPLRELKPEHLWIFLPERRELQIRGGHVRPEVAGEVISYGHAELFAELGNGYRVIVHFDPTEPTLGAAILNGEEPESTKNTQGWRMGQVLAIADYVETPPQFMAHASFSPSLDYRKKYNAWCSAAYRGTGLYGRRAGKTDEARDGAGNVARIEVGSRKPEAGSEDTAPRPNDGTLAAVPPPRKHRNELAAPTPDEWTRRQARTREEAEFSRRLRDESPLVAA
jgi:hypothetical protein